MPRLSKSPGLPPSITNPTSLPSSSKTADGTQTIRVTKSLPSNKLLPRLRTSAGTSKASVSQPAQPPPSANAEPSFICTICWQSQHAPSKPKLLGTSSRIVCRPCWKAVLDLSICWVCGECIVRGDEVVSLGWCFWHRACFGCLVCGTGMDLRGFEEGGGRWGGWNDSGMTREDGAGEVQRSCEGTALGKRKRKRMIGVELERVPLCEDCDVEAAGKPYEEVVEKGLETISRFDGGLTRDRLDMLSEEREEPKTGSRLRWKRSRFRGSSGLERELKRFINGSTSRWSEFDAANDPEARKAIIKHAAEMGVSEDGNVDEDNSPIANSMADFGQHQDESPSVVYVSVLNPLGEPPFKPTKIKPLPKWMSLLPNNVHRERKRRRTEATSEPSAHTHEMTRLGERRRTQHGRCNSENDHENFPTYNAYAPQPSARQKTAYPSRRRSSMTRSETTSSSARGLPKIHIPNEAEVLHPQAAGLEMPDPSPKSSATDTPSRSSSIDYISLHSEGHSPLLVSSSEYLDRYKPIAPKASYHGYVAKEPEPIMDKIRRQRVSRPTLDDVADVNGDKRENCNRVRKVEVEDYVIDPAREDLKKELRSLFCED